MLPSTNKYKLYLYFAFFVFLTSIFNFQILENYQKKFSINRININGLSHDEKKIIQTELNNFLNLNIFKLKEDKILEKLNKFNYLENIYIKKIIPSSINVNLAKTIIVGKTTRNGKNYYLGKNGKFINYNYLSEINNIPIVFGNFKLEKYLELQNTLNDNQLDLKKIDKYLYFKNKRWDLVFSNGLTLMLPSSNIGKSIKIYKKLLNSNKLINTKIVDFRSTNQIILTKNNE